MLGQPKEDRVARGRAEPGRGIDGEAGIEQVPFAGAGDAAGRVLGRLLPHLADGPHVALLNILGGTTPLEMGALADEVARSSFGRKLVGMVGPDPQMTSLDMHGFSLPALPAEPAWMEALAAPAAPLAWPGLVRLAEPEVRPRPDGVGPIQPVASPHPGRRALAERCARALVATEDALNALDARSTGDRDADTTLATTAHALLQALDRLPLADVTRVHRADGGGAQPDYVRLLGSAAGDLLRHRRRRGRERKGRHRGAARQA